jgi:hypothetical protein
LELKMAGLEIGKILFETIQTIFKVSRMGL